MSDAASPTLALLHVRLIDGVSEQARDDMAVLIEGDRITQVAPAQSVQLAPDVPTLDLAGMTLMPGLIDGHMHVTSFPGLLDHDGHIRQNLQAAEVLRNCLLWGTTTVGHAGGCRENLILKDMVDRRQLPGRARLLVSGVVTATGGHVPGRAADGPWEIRKAVREMVRDQLDFIKTTATGGFQWAHEGLGQPDYTLEELEAVVDEAHMRHKRVHVHAHAAPGLHNAVHAGCDIILHGAAIDDHAIEGIARRGLFYMPTLFITSRHIYERPGLPAHMTDRMKIASPGHREGVARAHRSGVKIATGSDGPPIPGAIMNELEELVGCGLTPMQAIVAATRTTADAFGLLDDLGTIEPGKRADLIAVKGDPLVDISLMTHQPNIACVIKDGRIEKQP